MASSQKFIARNRAPRVQIEYDVEVYGAEKKVQLPFVMGVMADLAGTPADPLPAVADRKFLDIDVDNFDSRMKAMRPRAAFAVPNTLTGEGSLSVDLTFEAMDDFAPAAIARKVEPLRALLQARTDLANLMTYMDGKAGAEGLIERVLSDPLILSALAAGPTEPGASAVLDALRNASPVALQAPTADPTASALAALRATAPVTAAEADETADALAGLRAAAPGPNHEPDGVAEALAALRAAAPVAAAEADETADALAGLRATAPGLEDEADTTADALAALRAAPVIVTGPDRGQDALASLRIEAPSVVPVADDPANALDALRATLLPGIEQPAEATAALAALRASAPVAKASRDDTEDALAALRSRTVNAASQNDDGADALSALRARAVDPVVHVSKTADALATLRSAAPVAGALPDDATNALSSLRAAAPVAPVQTDDGPDALAALRAMTPPVGITQDDGRDALAAMRASALESAATPATDATADALAALRATHGGADAASADESATGSPAPTAAPIMGPPEGLSLADGAAGDDPLETLFAPDPLRPASGVEDPLAGLDELLAIGVRDVADVPAEPPGVPEAPGVPRPEDATEGDLADLDALLNFAAPTPTDPLADLNALLAYETPAPVPTPAPAVGDPLARPDGLDLAAPADPLADLDALLNFDAAGPALGPSEAALTADAPAAAGALDDLDALLAFEAAPPAAGNPLDDLDALLAFDTALPDDPLAALDSMLAAPAPVAKADPLDDLDALLSSSPPSAAPRREAAMPGSLFGRLAAPQPTAEALARPVFRMAILGDFSGRAARGKIEIGAALARRRGIPFDVDNVEEVVEGFAMNLVLPIGADGQGIAVPLTDLDSLHPDQLVENVALFEELRGLRQRLSAPSTADRAVAEMQAWGSAFRDFAAPSVSRSAATSVPADLRLSDFQRLIGDREGRLSTPSPAADLIAQIVGPHIVPGPNAEAKALRVSVDAAMSAAMRLVLHHPEFQAIEAQWRALDLLARRIETDSKLELVLYDISAEELGADLSVADDLAQTGLFGLMNGPLTEEGGVGFSAIFGHYTFEETPPHADLLGRMAKIAQHVQAPFFAAMSPGYLDTPKDERHPLVARAWDALRDEPAADWLGLASPRFLSRRPYGARSEPIDAFDFEEFTMAEGLSGMLWSNPVVLVAILLARAWTDGKGKPVLGQTMSVGEMPYHFVTDRDGDQVPLPCTERNMTTDKVEQSVIRGLMPVISIRGRDVVRLGSFQSVAGAEILGRWSGNLPPPRPPKPQPTLEAVHAPPAATSLDDDLDALLAGFGDAPAASSDPGAIDADLAALLEGL